MFLGLLSGRRNGNNNVAVVLLCAGIFFPEIIKKRPVSCSRSESLQHMGTDQHCYHASVYYSTRSNCY